MSYEVTDLLEMAHELEMISHRLRQRYQVEVARTVQFACDHLRKEIDVLVNHYEKQVEGYRDHKETHG